MTSGLAAPHTSSAASVFWVFLKLGLTSFGGPVAHLAYFRSELVQRRQWMSEAAYAQLVALCQFLPGPASSQVGMAMGLQRAGMPGMVAAWLGFTLPSALALALLGLGLIHFGQGLPTGLLQGLKVAAVAVVFQAVWGMTQQLCPDRARKAVLLMGLAISLLFAGFVAQLSVVALGGLWGWWWFTRPGASAPIAPTPQAGDTAPSRVSRTVALVCLAVLAALLVLLPIIVANSQQPLWQLVDTFFRTGAMVFGGGHVVLPLLQAELVQPGWVDADTFVAGYGATQAVPGPLFTFVAFLGSVMPAAPSVAASLGYATVALLAVFAPSFLLVLGVWPFWQQLQQHRSVQHALMGINAAVVGLLAAAWIQPMVLGTLHSVASGVLCVAATLALMRGRWAPWWVVAWCAAIGAVVLS